MAYATSTTNLRPPALGTPAAPLAGRARFAARPGRGAFTLIEAMIASSILAVAVIAIGTSLSTSVQQTASVDGDSTSLLLARQLMEEIAAKPFVDPATGTPTPNISAGGGSAVGSIPARAAFNDVGDYHGYADTVDAANPARSLQGKTAAVTNGRGYTRDVNIKFRTTPAGSSTTTGNFAIIKVTVTAPGGRSVTVWRMATNATLMQGSTL
jgi:Tfp pilus assembly protein PilV